MTANNEFKGCSMFNYKKKPEVIAWALYDFGNSAFATTVLAGFFPLFFKLYWSAGSDPAESTVLLGTANSFASLLVALLAPFLGAIADRGGYKRRFLILFTFLSVTATGLLYWVGKGDWMMAAAWFVAAQVGFSGAMIFYDAQICDVAEESEMHRVSTLGYAMGYLGGGLLFAINVLMYQKPDLFGISDGSQAIKISFLAVAFWWFLSSVPSFLIVKDQKPHSRESFFTIFKLAIEQLLQTGREISKHKNIIVFLAAYWVYIDGVGTVIRMAVDYGMSLGFDPGDLITALLLTQFVGIPSALAFGRIGDRFGAKNGIYICLAVYFSCSFYAYSMTSKFDFYFLAAAIGLVQGGVQALSRSIFAGIIPDGHQTEFFGFFNMLGKFAAVLGPVLMGAVSYSLGNPRYGILAVGTFFIIGGAILKFVDEHKRASL